VCFAARITAQTAITWRTSSSFPRADAGMVKPSAGDVAKTRTTISAQDDHRHPSLHRSISTKRDNAADISSLSAMGSSRIPSVVTRAGRGRNSHPPNRGRGRQQISTPQTRINRHTKKTTLGARRQKDNDEHRNKEDPQNR